MAPSVGLLSTAALNESQNVCQESGPPVNIGSVNLGSLLAAAMEVC